MIDIKAEAKQIAILYAEPINESLCTSRIISLFTRGQDEQREATLDSINRCEDAIHCDTCAAAKGEGFRFEV